MEHQDKNILQIDEILRLQNRKNMQYVEMSNRQ